MKCLPAILLIAILSATADAGWLPQPFSSEGAGASRTAAGQVPPAVVRIVAPGRDTVSYGSGALVAKNDKHGLVITNWHVINELTGQLVVVFPDGFQSTGTVLRADRDWDLAAITIWRPNAEPLRLAGAAPQPGETLTIAGYGSGNYRAASGKCTQYVSPGPKFPFEIVELEATARQGDSGGPIFNSRGEMAGVLFGEGHGRTAGSYCGRVQWFLSSIVPAGELGADKTMIAGRAAPPQGRVAARPVGLQTAPGATYPQPMVKLPSLVRLSESSPSPPAPPAVAAATAPPLPAPLPPRIAAPEQRFAAIPPRAAPPPPSRQFAPTSQPGARTAGNDVLADQSPGRHTIGWCDIAGDTRGEQLKTVFAAVGAAALTLHTLSWLGSEKRQPEAKKKKAAADEEDDDDDDDD